VADVGSASPPSDGLKARGQSLVVKTTAEGRKGDEAAGRFPGGLVHPTIEGGMG
jgi:hypothetical protein